MNERHVVQPVIGLALFIAAGAFLAGQRWVILQGQLGEVASGFGYFLLSIPAVMVGMLMMLGVLILFASPSQSEVEGS